MAAGDRVYAIKHKGLYFYVAYTDEDYAKRVACRMGELRPNEFAANFRSKPSFVSGRVID